MSDLSKTCMTAVFVLGAALILPGIAAAAPASAKSDAAFVLKSGHVDGKVIARRGADDSTARGGKKKRKHTGLDDGANHN